MDKFNFFNIPTAGISYSSGHSQSQPEAVQIQPVSFAGIATRVHPVEQAQISASPTANQLRHLTILKNVSPHSATQYLPQQGLPQPDFLLCDPFQANATNQPIRFDECSSQESDDDSELIRNVNELMGAKLKDTYVPVESGGNISELTQSVSTSISRGGTHSSVDHHCQWSLSGTSKNSQQLRRSTRKRTTTNMTEKVANTYKKRATSSARSTVSSTGPLIVPTSVPVTVQSNVSFAADNSPSEQILGPIDQWFIVKEGYEKPYHCSYPGCGKTYKFRFHLDQHLVTHSGVSKYKCPYPECVDKKCFHSSAMLTRHIRKTHIRKTNFM